MLEAQQRIEAQAKSRGLTDQEAMDVGFHMYDWYQDLKRLWEFTSDPNSYTDEELEQLLTQFLIHAPNHIAAAAKLYTGNGVGDIFGVGACDE
tara:strand:+ start:208 stop:486 length:279 start_codon:yes stop_codon:yes gene_type:complete